MELPFMDLATLAMAFPPCLSGKRPSLELCNHEMLMAFYPCLSRKRQKSWSRTNMSCSLSACTCGARNTLSFLPVEEKYLSFFWGGGQWATENCVMLCKRAHALLAGIIGQHEVQLAQAYLISAQGASRGMTAQGTPHWGGPNKL